MLKYKDLEIRAAEGLHDDCLEMIKNNVVQGADVIDLAAGAGAFSERMVDAGYNVTANDIDEKKWLPTHISKLTLDLNHPLESALPAGKYNAVVAMEVIEHLQNPSKLLEDCKRLVATDGLILLSTPNVMDIDSRLIFLRSGFVFHISPQSFFATGHRIILPAWLLELLIDEAGLDVVEKKWGGEVPATGNPAWRRGIMRLVKGIVRLFVKSADTEELDANYLIYLLRAKPTPAAP